MPPLGPGSEWTGTPAALRAYQLDAAVGPRIGVDRHSGRTEGVDISVHRPFRNLQALGQLISGEAAAGLEK